MDLHRAGILLVLGSVKAILPLFVACCLVSQIVWSAESPSKAPEPEARREAPPRMPGPEVPKIVLDPESIGRAELKERLKHIRLSNVVLKDLSLYQAVAALNKLADKQDKLVMKMAPRGLIHVGGDMPWIARMDENEEPFAPTPTIPGLEAPPVPPDMNPVVSYGAKNVSLADAIEGLARAGRRFVYIDSDAVYLTKKEHPPALITRIYLLPPSIVTDIAKQEREREKTPSTLKERSESMHNFFQSLRESEKDPDHTPQSFLERRTSRFTVRDTEVQHRSMTEMVEKGWQEYYASDEWKKRSKQ